MRSTSSHDGLTCRHHAGEGNPFELAGLRNDLRAMDAKVREALTQNAILQVRLDFVERLLNEERAHARQMRWAISVFAIVGAAAAVLSSILGR